MSGNGQDVNRPGNQPLVMSPLADPVVNAIFSSEKVAGLAAESLIRVILEAEGENRKVGKVVKVTPQRAHTAPGQRGSRIDIEILTDSNEIAIVEVQISSDEAIMQRNLFAASHIYTKTSSSGTTPPEMAEQLPTVIAINILNYPIREDNNEILQPFKILYTKPPLKEAIPQFSGYNVQLSRIPDITADFNSGFYCWFYTLYKADHEGKTVKEIVDMTPELQIYSDRDTGYQQFCTQYDLAAGDPETRDEYVLWVKDRMREYGMKKASENEGIAKGRAEADAQWQGVVAEKDVELEAKDTELKAKDAIIAELKARLDESKDK